MPEARLILLIAQKELREAIRNRWFLAYSIGFAVLATGLTWAALSVSSSFGIAGFGRASAGMINLVLLVVPLMGLTLGALSIAGERERGELLVTLAQPVGRMEVLLGKYLGIGVALIGSLAFGFGVSGTLVAVRSGTVRIEDFLVLVGMTGLLALVSLSMGFAISAGTRRGATALGISIFAWLAMAFFSDLGLMASAMSGNLGAAGAFNAAMANPLQVFKVAVVLSGSDNLEVLGPAGVYAVRTYGAGLLAGLVGLLVAWTVAPLALAYPLMKRRGAV